jgi:hypothetical protein
MIFAVHDVLLFRIDNKVGCTYRSSTGRTLPKASVLQMRGGGGR